MGKQPKPGDAARAWSELIGHARPVFTAPGFGLFGTLTAGWVLAVGRRTVCGMIGAADPEGVRAHDAYHRFFRAARWSPARLWQTLVVVMVERLCPQGRVMLDLDDTLFHKTGLNVAGAGMFRDAVRSTHNHLVCAWGLNLVVLTLRVPPPWGGCPLALPVGVRLHSKDGVTTLALGEAMIRQLADWLPDRSFHLCADGAYASLCGAGLPRTTVTSRMRRDAAIYEPPPPRTGRRGRPRVRGDRLPTPTQLAEDLDDDAFTPATIDYRGRPKDVLVNTRRVLWYSVDPKNLVELVIVRDPTNHEPEDFFVTTDHDATGTEIASRYPGRWAIECTNRNVKQALGAENPQCWKKNGPERAAMLSLWLYSAIWCWYIPLYGTTTTWTARPWYPHKTTPSFQDALTALRRCLWTQRITALSSLPAQPAKIIHSLIDQLAQAA